MNSFKFRLQPTQLLILWSSFVVFFTNFDNVLTNPTSQDARICLIYFNATFANNVHADNAVFYNKFLY